MPENDVLTVRKDRGDGKFVMVGLQAGSPLTFNVPNELVGYNELRLGVLGRDGFRLREDG